MTVLSMIMRILWVGLLFLVMLGALGWLHDDAVSTIPLGDVDAGALSGVPIPDSHVTLPRELLRKSGDPDGDGEQETLVIYKSGDDSSFHIRGAIVENSMGGSVIALPEDAYLGEGLFPDETRLIDLDGDNRDEIVIVSGTGAHIHILSVFVWNSSGYSFAGQCGGDIDASVQDLDHDGILELIGENGCYECNDDAPATIKRISVYRLRGERLELERSELAVR